MARPQRGKKVPRPSSTDYDAPAGGPADPGTVGPAAGAAAAEPERAAGAEAPEPVAPEPLIVVYESSERDWKTRLQIVQSGFGSTAAWTAVVDAWRDTSASFGLLAARVLAPLGRSALAALGSARHAPALSPALRPAPARP